MKDRIEAVFQNWQSSYNFIESSEMLSAILLMLRTELTWPRLFDSLRWWDLSFENLILRPKQRKIRRSNMLHPHTPIQLDNSTGQALFTLYKLRVGCKRKPTVALYQERIITTSKTALRRKIETLLKLHGINISIKEIESHKSVNEGNWNQIEWKKYVELWRT